MLRASLLSSVRVADLDMGDPDSGMSFPIFPYARPGNRA